MTTTATAEDRDGWTEEQIHAAVEVMRERYPGHKIEVVGGLEPERCAVCPVRLVSWLRRWRHPARHGVTRDGDEPRQD